jgi:hypothetical protein
MVWCLVKKSTGTTLLFMELATHPNTHFWPRLNLNIQFHFIVSAGVSTGIYYADDNNLL